MLLLKRNTSILSDLGAQILKDAEYYYHEHAQFSDVILQSLHSVYGQTLEDALDLVDRGKFIQYCCEKTKRNVFIVTKSTHHFTLYENILFCICNEFKNSVLTERAAAVCCHILALKLARIMNIIKVEQMTESHLVQLLNNQIGDVFKNDDDV